MSKCLNIFFSIESFAAAGWYENGDFLLLLLTIDETFVDFVPDLTHSTE